MSHREWFSTVLTEVNYTVLAEDLDTAGISNVEGLSADLANDLIGVDFPDGYTPSAGEIAAIQGVIDSHDATDYDGIQKQTASDNTKALYTGLRQLNPEDATYAAYGRAWAIKNGESQGTILDIVDRATAGVYITGQSEWSDLPVESRQFYIDHTDAMMKIVQGIVRVIT